MPKKITRKPKKKTFSSKHHKRKKFLKLAAKIHSAATIFILLSYLSIGIFGGPEYLLKDVKNKYEAAAATTALSVRLVGPPGKPAVIAVPSCSSTNPIVTLNWNATSDTTDYDVYRNGNILISGITGTSFADSSVQASTTYVYYIVANGPQGNTQSDLVSVTTGACFLLPNVQIITIDNTSLSSFSGTPEISTRTPNFSGTTNIQNAIIDIQIYSGPVVSATTNASINGYWSWTSPIELDYGSQTIYITATDPNDISQSAQTSLNFTIKEEENEKEKEKKKGHKTVPAPVPVPVSSTAPSAPAQPTIPPTILQKPAESIPLEFKISITNPDKIAYSGKDLNFNFEIARNDSSLKNTDVSYSIISADGKIIESWSENISLSQKNQTLNKKTALSKFLNPGKYKIMALATVDGKTIAGEDWFQLKENPILNFSGIILTYPILLKYVGWILFWLLFALIFLLLLLGIEHHLSTGAAFHITENYLKKKGVISERKGVLK
jgi:hypothetical protein